MYGSRTFFTSVFFLAFALVQAPALAANLGLIDGTVHDYEDKPVTGTKVQLLSKDGRRTLDEHVTDENGHFEFEQVPFGIMPRSKRFPDAWSAIAETNVMVPTTGVTKFCEAPILLRLNKGTCKRSFLVTH